MTHLTFSELERAAYISGNTALADAYHAMDTLQLLDDNLPMDFDLFSSPQTIDQQLDSYVESKVSKECPDYADYKQFFDDCFEHLDGHYPCASVTNGYDCSVIFDAIRKGEGG